MTTNGLALRTMDDVERIARIAVASGYTACRKMEEAAMLVITGQELGLSPAQSLRGIYVVSGKPVLSADLMVAVVRRSGLCASWRTVESTAERCTITTRRQGEEHDSTRTWTMADAKRAGVTGKSTWSQYPAAMLRHRCAADLAREVYPDVLMGLYDPEEMEPAEPAARTEVVRIDSREGLDALDASRQIAAPSALASWRADLADATTCADVRAAFAAWRADIGDDARAAVVDVRAWCDAAGIMLDGAGVTALLSTLPGDALRCLDVSRGGVEAIVAAGRVCRHAGWDDHSTMTVWSALARGYAAATGAKSVKVAAAALKTVCEEPPPSDGTDGPSAPRSAANDTATAEGSAAPSSGTDGPVALAAPDAWRLSAAGITAHVAEIGNIPRLANSARRNLAAIVEPLRTHAVHVYAGRLQALSHDGTSTLTWEACVARAETWLREGPKDAAAPPQRRTRRAA